MGGAMPSAARRQRSVKLDRRAWVGPNGQWIRMTFWLGPKGTYLVTRFRPAMDNRRITTERLYGTIEEAWEIADRIHYNLGFRRVE